MNNIENQRRQLRQIYLNVWQKMTLGHALEPMEERISIIIQMHPEYHEIMKNKEVLNMDFNSEGIMNPFIHMGLHISIHEQVGLDHPAGVQEIYYQLAQKHQEPHKIEHLMIDCLSKNAKIHTQEINTSAYLECLKLQI
ncbi:MAG: DUF1841 family protein [Gammaproteobacteria bacterium]|nr:DUF1841 family protein [Gammaproteobacteria bacterium]